MYYEFQCAMCTHYWLERGSMDSPPKVGEVRDCPACGGLGTRILSRPAIHMNEWVADGYRRTTEPPEELKPGIKRLQNERDDLKHMTSYPNSVVKRKKGFKN